MQILDRTGTVVRTYKGTHEVEKKQEPYVPNKVGLNRFVWDWTIDGPVKWTGAAKKAYQGPDDGPVVPPGLYIGAVDAGQQDVHAALHGQSRSAHDLHASADRGSVSRSRRLGEALYSQVDTMLNNLDTVKKSIDDGIAAAKKAGDTRDAEQARSASRRRASAVFDELTANYQNDEDSIQMPGKVREDVQSIMFFARHGDHAGAARLRAIASKASSRTATAHYNAFVKAQVPALNDALTTLKLKAVTIQ